MKGTPKKPRDLDAAISAAYLRLTGARQDEAAAVVGIGSRTLRGWEHSPWWPEVEAAARGRWLRGMEAATRAALLDFVSKDPSTARFVAERLFPEFAPPRRRQDLETGDAGPVVLQIIEVPGTDP